ncbi:uncharacterized protein LOC124387373 [Silurus meridionalis]|uniref:uncharacterized protein LOC124387373 n=1 Tax=Silurus meridionalis TaxID=175797 RepID=UPI001EEB8F2B|nr:uncharacterized protein LOC124387373 [Silurus meridionalis]
MELSSLPVMLMLVSLLPVAHAQAKPTLTVRSLLWRLNTENTITLSCELQDLREWEFFWYRNSQIVSTVATDTNTFSVNVNNAGETVYQCGARWRSNYNYNTVLSDPVKITAKAKPQPSVRVNPQHSIYTGDTITLSCELQETTGWKFFWYKNSQLVNNVATNTLHITVDNAGEPVYQCRASRIIYNIYNNYQYFYTGLSDFLKIKAKERPQAVLSVSPQNWLTEGDSVTLSCEVTDSSTDWTFSWYTVVPYRDSVTQIKHTDYFMYVELLSDSSRGSGGSYTFSPSALHHTGVYVCRGERRTSQSHTVQQSTASMDLW